MRGAVAAPRDERDLPVKRCRARVWHSRAQMEGESGDGKIWPEEVNDAPVAGCGYAVHGRANANGTHGIAHTRPLKRQCLTC